MYIVGSYLISGHSVLPTMSMETLGPHQKVLEVWSCRKRPHLEYVPGPKEPMC